MGRVRQRDTKPEVLVRSLLHRLGLRFTIGSRLNRTLPGRPDVVLPRHRTVVFVHGCFWHAHAGCKAFKIPSTRAAFWREKFRANRKRDRIVISKLEELGWRVVVVWSCELKGKTAVAELSRRLARDFTLPLT